MSNPLNDPDIKSLLADIDDETHKLRYDQNLLAEEEMTSKTELLPLHRPMISVVGYPENWLFNVTTIHDDKKNPCHCDQCYKKDYPHLCTGEPVMFGALTVEQMKSTGTMGLYTSPPIVVHKCAVCGEDTDWRDTVEDDVEVVHVDCLSEEHRQNLLIVGYCRKSILIRKGERDDENREMVVGSSDHECPDEGGPGEGGESPQSDGEEEDSLVQAGGNGSSKQPRQPGMDIYSEQVSEGTGEGPIEAGPREETAYAEEDTDNHPVLCASGDGNDAWS